MRALSLVLVACGSTAKPAPVPPASCEDATLRYESSVDAPKDKRHATIVKRCTDDTWSVEARDCFAKLQPLDDPRDCRAKLGAPQRDALDRDIASLTRPPPPPRVLTPCEQYAARIEHIMGCDKLPQMSRDALAQGLDAVRQGFDAIEDQPPEVRAQMDDACRSGVEALDSAVSELCPP